MSNPTFSEMSVHDIAWQYQVKHFIRKEWNYADNGLLEILLSGSVGSAKSIFAAHMAVSHCLIFPKAHVGLFRRALPDIKDTIFATILEHIEGSRIWAGGHFITMTEGAHYWVNRTRASIRFFNGAKISSAYWADKKYKRLRSKNYSAGIFEEVTENTSEEFLDAYPEIVSRIGRVSRKNADVTENWLLCCTNPDGESHAAYEYFILNPKRIENRKVFYSLTEQNPFLEKSYIENLKRSLTPIQARRKLRGEWIDDASDKVYSCYAKDKHYRDEDFKYNPDLPIRLTFDFNVGDGKPFSMTVFQYDPKRDHFDFFREVVVESARTNDIMDELAERGILDLDCPKFIVHGDPAGKNKDTRNLKTDYGLIEKYLANYERADGKQLIFEIQIPSTHPAIRKRHIEVNSYFENALGESRATVWNCSTLDKGFRLTILKKGGSYIEDDGKAHPYQHITTAAGYGICETLRRIGIEKELERRKDFRPN